MAQNNETRIPRAKILKLYESSLNEVSTHSVEQWLKIVTESKFIVIPTESVDQLIDCSVNIKEFSDILTHVEEDVKNWM